MAKKVERAAKTRFKVEQVKDAKEVSGAASAGDPQAIRSGYGQYVPAQ